MNWEVRTASLLLCLGTLLATVQDGTAEKKIVCYYTNWSVYRPGTAKFSPQNINPYLCTHLIYAFGGFTKDNAMKPFDKYQDIEKGGYAKFTGLKTYNKNLKTMLAIGGWNEGSSRFSPMVADSDRRRQFVKNAIKFLRQNHFDGLDLDWEYPAFRDGGKPRDKNNYADLVQELRAEFDRESAKTGRPRLLLTMAIPAGLEYLEKGYDLPRLNEYLDFFNLLSYDYHSAYEPAVNHHSPLYPLEEDNEYNYDNELTIDYTINYLLRSGVSPEKIVLGIPTYGRSYTLFNEDASELGSPADGPGVEGDATREKGYLAYYEICESLADSDEWEVVQPNPTAMGPYAFKGNQWVGYDDENIVKLKARYASERNLGGIMFWSIDNDDFRGKCHGRPYPLIEAAKESLLTSGTKDSPSQKSNAVSNRKKNRGSQGIQSNIIGRKSSRSGTTTTSTSAPASRKRVPSSRSKFRSRKNNNEAEEEKEIEGRSFATRASDSDGEDGNSLRSIEQSETRSRASRPKSRAGAGRRKQSKRKEQKKDEENEEGSSLSVKLTTPEPPTTPDPGSDFKCEDEGFFPHPRDCKKYFWCLDSGPGGLGIVGHQFTCPSGLVFNKAADSCDYPRNVICPKTKTTQTTVSTTRAPITAATSRTTYLHSTTRRTTTNKPESEEEYEYYEDEDEESEEEEEEEEPKFTTTARPLQYKTINRSRPTTPSTVATTTTTATTRLEKSDAEKTVDIEEEDPRVIKELINLIKKAGGIEQLEKQLLAQEKGAQSGTSDNENVTPAAISRTLYERVLNRQAAKAVAANRPAVTSTVRSANYANGPGGSQFEGLDEVPEVKSLRRTYKPQYVTIERPKPTTQVPLLEDEEEEEEDGEEVEDDNTDVDSSEEQSVSNPVQSSTSGYRITPSYVNIRRNRPATTTSKTENDVDEKNDEEEEEERPLRRRRPFFNKNVKNEEGTDESPKAEASEGDKFIQRSRSPEETSTAKSRYVGIQRFRSTTAKTAEFKSDEPNEEEIVTTTTASLRLPSIVETTTTRDKASTKSESDVSSDTSSSLSVTSGLYIDTTHTSPTTGSTVATTTPTSDELSTSTATSAPDSSSTSSTTSTESAVKLVEDSATEILLTTAEVSTGPPGSSTSRSTASATVSQPRPFGFSRRRLVTSPASSSTAAPAATSQADNARSKVSTAARNPARQSSSFLLGRTRTRSTTESPETANAPILEEAQLESPQSTADVSAGRPRQRGSALRGSNRFTTTTKSAVPRVDEVSENSAYRGRTRTRVRASQRASSVSRVDVTTGATVEEVTARVGYRSRARGTFKTSTEATASSNVGYRTRGRTAEPRIDASEKSSTESPRRYGRPLRTTTETSAVNEIEDSPIVRISQAQPRKSSIFKARFGNNTNGESVTQKITNIRVFKRPSAINHELYERTKTTQNDLRLVEAVGSNAEDNKTSDNTQETSSYFYATTPSFKDFQDLENNDTILLNDTVKRLGTVDVDAVNALDGGLDESTAAPAENDSDETDYNVEETATPQLDSTTISTTQTENVSVPTIKTSEDISPNTNTTVGEGYDIVKIIYNNSTEEINASNNATSHPRKKKIVLRRRPVGLITNETSRMIGNKENNRLINGTTLEDEKGEMQEIERQINSTNNDSVRKDDHENRQVIRRRKVIRRLRPVQNENVSSTTSSSTTNDEQSVQSTSKLLLQFTTPLSEFLETELPDTFKSTNSDSDDGNSFTTITTEGSNSDDDNVVNDFTETQFLHSELTTTDSGLSDFLTIENTSKMDLTTIQPFAEMDEINTESSTLPLTVLTTENVNLSSASMDVTENVLTTNFTEDDSNGNISRETKDSVVTQTPFRVTEAISRTNIQSTTGTENLLLEISSTTSIDNSDSRFVRRKFVRKRPVSASEDAGNRRPSDSRLQKYFISSTTEKSDGVALKRRKNLYIRRRPVSSTTVRTTETAEDDPLHYEEEEEEEEEGADEPRDVENERTTEATTLGISVDDNSPGASNSFFNNDAQQFWSRYTTPTSLLANSYVPDETKTTRFASNKEDKIILSSSSARRRYPIPQSTTASSLTTERRSRYLGFRQSRNRQQDFNRRDEEESENQNENKPFLAARSRFYLNRSPSTEPSRAEESEKQYKEFSSQSTKNRFYSRPPTIFSTEPTVTETLIPARKFDFAADALNRRQQTVRPSLKKDGETTKSEGQNFVADDLTMTTSQPLVTRLITSVTESGTTERQKILIKTKYSSHTSTARIPIRGSQGRFENPSTTESVNAVSSTLEKSTNQAVVEDSIANEVRPGFERSTLPIEGEFVHYNGAHRFTTESQGSSTIEIESVFSNLIPNAKEITK